MWRQVGEVNQVNEVNWGSRRGIGGSGSAGWRRTGRRWH